MYEIKASKVGWAPEGESEEITLGYGIENDWLDLYVSDSPDAVGFAKAKKRTVELIVRVWDND